MEVIKIKLENLFLDPNNYRLRSNSNWNHVDLNSYLKPAIQKRTTNFIIGDNNNKINDLIESFKSNGYLKVDSILVKKFDKSENYIVIEGNRRIAALKVLKEQFDKGYDIGKLDPELLEKEFDVVLYEYENNKDYLILMGLKHVSGNKKWDFYNQAKLLDELKKNGEIEIDISKKIGISKTAVMQQLRGYSAMQYFIEDVKHENYSIKYDPYDKLQMFIELTTRPKLKYWVGWDDIHSIFINKDNKERFFEWIRPKIEIDDNNEEITLEPIILSHKQVRDLEDIIDDEETLKQIEETRNFEEARNQNFAYSQKQFSKIIKEIEKKLRNIPIGNTLNFTDDDMLSVQNIMTILENFITINDNNEQ